MRTPSYLSQLQKVELLEPWLTEMLAGDASEQSSGHRRYRTAAGVRRPVWVRLCERRSNGMSKGSRTNSGKSRTEEVQRRARARTRARGHGHGGRNQRRDEACGCAGVWRAAGGVHSVSLENKLVSGHDEARRGEAGASSSRICSSTSMARLGRQRREANSEAAGSGGEQGVARQGGVC